MTDARPIGNAQARPAADREPHSLELRTSRKVPYLYGNGRRSRLMMILSRLAACPGHASSSPPDPGLARELSPSCQAERRCSYPCVPAAAL
jgi:hypothetical protein